MLDEWARSNRRASEWAREVRQLAPQLPGIAGELAREASEFAATAKATALVEAGFRTDAARAHLPPAPDRRSRPGDGDLLAAGALLREQQARPAIQAAPLAEAADRFDRAAD